MKPIRLTKHAQEQCIERGATESEVRYTILHGCREPAKLGRELCRFSFPFNKNWHGSIVMKISYDPEVDALYIRLIDGKHECRTLRLNEEIALNIGPGEKLVGIEILDAKEVLGSGTLPNLVVENLPLAKV